MYLKASADVKYNLNVFLFWSKIWGEGGYGSQNYQLYEYPIIFSLFVNGAFAIHIIKHNSLKFKIGLGSKFVWLFTGTSIYLLI